MFCLVPIACGCLLAQLPQRQPEPQPPAPVTSEPMGRDVQAAAQAATRLLGVTPDTAPTSVVRTSGLKLVVPTTPLRKIDEPLWDCRFENVVFLIDQSTQRSFGPFEVRMLLQPDSMRVVTITLHKPGSDPVPEIADPVCFQQQLAGNGPEIWTDLLPSVPRATLQQVLKESLVTRGGFSSATDLSISVVLATLGNIPQPPVPVWSLYAQGLNESEVSIRLRQDMLNTPAEQRDAYTFMRYVVRDDPCAGVSETNSPVPKKYSADWCRGVRDPGATDPEAARPTGKEPSK